MKMVAQKTDVWVALASRTVKKRIKICGNPAVPNINASPSEIPETGSFAKNCGAKIATPVECTFTAPASNAPKSKFAKVSYCCKAIQSCLLLTIFSPWQGKLVQIEDMLFSPV